MSDLEFMGFPKIPRYSRDCVITEKIDGTNGQIYLIPVVEENWAERNGITHAQRVGNYWMFIGSRTHWLGPTEQNDNHGFFKWAIEHKEELTNLGGGRHYGEWWGQGIRRGYGLKEKRFSLFNVKRWGDPEIRPKCCEVVPIIISGMFSSELVENALGVLRNFGSLASPGFTKPEGIIIYHTAGNLLFKKTLEKDEKGKGEE